MELHQVRYFLALTQSLNFTRAAEKCHVTQPALTKAIQKLELELGGPLIHRERQLTQLTDLGKLVLPMLERTLSAADAVRLNAQEFQSKKIAPLRIALARSISASLVMRPLHEIARHMPGLQVELVEADRGGILDLLLGGGVGAALAGDELRDRPDRIDHWALFEERIVVTAAESSAFAAKSLISIEELHDAVWLEPIGCEVTKMFWRTHFPPEMAPRISHRGHQLSHLQHMVAAGLGVMLTPEHFPAFPGVVARSIVGDPIRRRVELLVMAGRQYSPALEAFVKTARTFDWCSRFENFVAQMDKPRQGNSHPHRSLQAAAMAAA